MEPKIEIYSAYSAMLDEWEKVRPPKPLAPPTFMEVMGYPHWENVWSNILAFFLNDSNEHGMRNLWAKSLLECAKEDSNSGCAKPERDITGIDINREYPTDTGKSIDILVCADNYVIGIENKVTAPLYNDLDDYADKIQEKAKSIEIAKYVKPVCVVLSIRDEQKAIDEKPLKSKWKNVTYTQLFNQVLKNFGGYVEDANEKWIIFMKDFIKTGNNIINRMTGGSNMCFDDELIGFLRNNAKRSSEFLQDMYKVKRGINQQVNALKALIDVDSTIKKVINEDPLKKGTCKISAWPGEDGKDLVGSAVIEIEIENSKYVVEALFDYEWRVLLWNRDNKMPDANQNILQEINKRKADFGIKADVSLDDREEELKRPCLGKFGANAPIEDVLEELRHGVDIVAKMVRP